MRTFLRIMGLLSIVLMAIAAGVFGQTSDGNSSLPSKIVYSGEADCSMTDLPQTYMNDRSFKCAQPGVTNFISGEIRWVKAAIGNYTLSSADAQPGHENTSCYCSDNGQWTRTMALQTTGSTTSIKWQWKYYGRDSTCIGLVLRKTLTKYGCPLTTACNCIGGYVCTPEGGCEPTSPILIDLNGDGVVRLTSRADGVLFDLLADGEKEQLPWLADAVDGWLVLNDTEDGIIVDGSQLFGDRSAQGPEKPVGEKENGYRALRGFDQNKDDAITEVDGIWRLLGIWRDYNHNGTSEVGEVTPLVSNGIASISLNYKESRKRDKFGNEFRYRADVLFVNGKKTSSWDVFLTGK